MKILFIVPYSTEGASNRYRVEQYLPYLKAEGIEYDVRPFVFGKFYKIIYLKGRYFEKIIYFIQALFRRVLDVIKLYKFDLVFIHREACPFGPPVFEWLAFKLNKPIIFDFDDAIFLRNFNPANRFYGFLKFPSKTKKIIRMSSRVIVSNSFLEEFASRYNARIHIIPTPIDIERFRVAEKKTVKLIIGWIGSPTTAPYLKIIFNAMKNLSEKYDFVLKLVGVSKPVSIPGVKLQNCDWWLKREVEDFQSIDIGIYPLPDTLWACGKAAFKAIQYMACGIPTVASPVGMTKEIIQDGVNGFLAKDEQDWIEKISKLIEDAELRETIGLAGRKTVEEKFSVKANVPRYLEVINGRSRVATEYKRKKD